MEESAAVATRKPTNNSEVGAMAGYLEEFAWRFDEALAPSRMTVRPYVLKSNFQKRLVKMGLDAEARQQTYVTLDARRVELETRLLTYDDDEDLDRRQFEEKEKTKDKLVEVLKKLEEFGDLPRSTDEVMADEFFLKVIAEWDLTDNGQPIPLTREGVLSLNPIVFGKLRDDLTDFLSPERRKKKRR